MADLPQNNTNRLFVDYTTGRVQHTFTVRYESPATAFDARDAAETFLTSLSGILNGAWTTIGTRVSLAGSNISLPGPEINVVGDGGAGPLDAGLEPRFFSYSGRSIGEGKQLQLPIYGIVGNQEPDYRMELTDSASLNSAWEDLEAFSIGNVFIAIDGASVIWKKYINVGFNAYWQRQRRRSS